MDEPRMVECEITQPGYGPYTVNDLETARAAVELVMGEGRQVEQGSLGNWLVEFKQAEIDVLDAQGYIELAKGRFVILAEMP
jgi:hypothetical protein